MKRRWTIAAFGLLAVLWVALIASGKGVLVSQRLVRPGETFLVPGWGDLGTAQQAQLACRYFVGTRVRWEVYWYEPSGFMGRADCPVFIAR